MKMRGRFVALLAVGLAAPLLVGGCKDQAAQNRAEIQKTIARVGRELEQTPTPLTPDDKRFEETRRALNGILASLSAVGEGEAGQQAAGALLAAAAHRKLASLSLVQAEQIESGLSRADNENFWKKSYYYQRLFEKARERCRLSIDANDDGVADVTKAGGSVRLVRD